MNKKGFTLLEIIVGTAITTFVISISFSAINSFIKLYKELNYNEYYSSNYRVLKTIEDLIQRTSVETESDTVAGSHNIGFKILNTSKVYLSQINSRSITRYIITFGGSGDSLYIEIPYLKSDHPIEFSNNFFLFRFVFTNSVTGEQTLNYIVGKSPGSKTSPLNFGLEEVVLKKIYYGKFTELKGGVLMEYTTKKGDVIHELFIRRGEL